MSALAYFQRRLFRAQQILKFQDSNKILTVFQRLESSFVPKQVLILTKISRYDIEKYLNPKFTENQLKSKLIATGANYDAIVDAHHRNKDTEKRTVETLRKLKITHRIKNRHNIDLDSITWADLIVSVGGDGTFLLASNLIGNNKKPIIGINSDPECSEGFLMLPAKYTNNTDEVFEKLKSGNFKYLMRSRIRTTLHGENVWEMPFHMHEKSSSFTNESFYLTQHKATKPKGNLPKKRDLPWLALNEVFIGESLSARISTLKIDVGNGTPQKVKCSGICVSSGTGSTSWFRAINFLNLQTVEDVLTMAGCKENYSYKEMEKICFDFNSKLQYPAEQLKISYVIRDMIVNHIWPLPNCVNPRGYCDKLTVQSQCFDGGLVIDGGIAYRFNVGTIAELQILDKDSLRNIVLLD